MLFGLLVKVPPSALPHEPLTEVTFAEQLWLVPPLVPLQVQLQGPVPETLEALPAEQRLLVGLLGNAPPSALPHAPSTGVTDAEQLWLDPPLVP